MDSKGVKTRGQNIKLNQTKLIIEVHLPEMMVLTLEVTLKISVLISWLKL